ncbi:MAG TPA: helix-turn-helix domain-containing protein [Ktedonobacterales bacterium]|nr:helix-turn-helix domain-containing protein [Ktedonobacterales bacterium]
MKRTIELTDPRTLRALAHPTRLALVGLLRQHGTLTATQAARLLGLNSGACSFHLRQLAKYGLVEEVPGPGRQKPWRATAQVTSWPAVVAGPEMAEAVRALSSVLVGRYAELMLDWTRRRADEPEEWQRAAWFGDMLLHITPDELYALGQEIERLVAPYEQRVFEREGRPAESRLVTALHIAIPRDTAGNEALAMRKEPV